MSDTFAEYENEALRTAPALATHTDRLLLGALGLSGEAGEYTDHIKKQLFHHHAEDREKALDELGDTLWYLAHAARTWSSSLGAVARQNALKLRRRYPDGFSAERSAHRAP